MIFSCWLLKGQRLELGVGGGRKRLNILGAYSPEDQEYIDIRQAGGTFTYTQVIALLEKIQAKNPGMKTFVIYLDNARYQHAKALKAWIAQKEETEGIRFQLNHLPAYSPNLNLIERMWKFLRKTAFRTWYDTFEDMQKAVDTVLDNLDQYEEELRTLMTENFRIIEKPETLAA
jgi:transposase